jgi:aerobic-type carbon monoxide dehydrogenase small subunit (CoxS/CutS family)
MSSGNGAVVETFRHSQEGIARKMSKATVRCSAYVKILSEHRVVM